MNLISYFARHQGPVKLGSNWIVRIDAHFIGGGRHFGTWEVADIGLMMIFRRNGRIVRSKISLLQSKKLYASPLRYVEDSRYVRRFGLGRLLLTDDEHAALVSDTLMKFTMNSKYRAYRKGSNQQDTMGHFERRWGTEMYYLFYNPLNIPFSVKMPMETMPELPENVIGCRVIQKKDLDHALRSFSDGHSPTYREVLENLNREYLGVPCSAGWSLEEYAADLMLKCKVGLADDSQNYENLRILMDQKSMPMSCALSVTFDMPS